ncbi:cell death activator CIDE-B [Protopterus annectens]|uniref:cell death activator CIDE-B n=1 Tax=Protopterus annectens TaxID=7888 RepID=UPI001CF96BE4|nr:cell death activator CIDE-B [Protopterus annectens]
MMEYVKAKEFVSNLPFVKSVSSMGTELSKRVSSLTAPNPRPYRICNHDRHIKKGVTACSLRELIVKAMETLMIAGTVSVVLEEDGTLVETEEFFEMLDNDTTFMVLEKGQRWRHAKSGVVSYSTNEKPKNSKDIARITFDIYKLHPRDLFGSLNVKATFYGLYSMSVDFKCLGPKKVLREVLRLASSLMHGLGNLFLVAATCIRRIIDGPEQWQPVRVTEYLEQ